jgi:glycosyltransferase involved in cell wall biosynthesis
MPETLIASDAIHDAGSVDLTSVDLSVVMPVYNEERALPRVLAEAAEALRAAPFHTELVLVDDASTDRSFSIMNEFELSHPELRCRILRHNFNRGIMQSLDTLFAAATGKYVFINASDGQCSTCECVRMMELRERFDVVVGKRMKKRYTPWRAFLSWSFNALPKLLFGVSTYDAGSIKLYRRDVLAIRVISRSPFREAERLIRAQRRGYRIGTISIEHRIRAGGKATGARWGLVERSILDLLRCWWDIVIRGNA